LKTIAGILIIAILALAGYRRSFTRISTFRRYAFFLTGTEFILVGLLLGDSFLGILDEPTLHHLYPFLVLGLGWIGLLTGIQLEWGGLKLFPMFNYAWILCFALCSFLLIYTGLYLLLHPWFFRDPLFHPALALLSVAGLCSGQTSIALWMQHTAVQDRSRAQILQFVASMNDVIAIFLFGILVCGVSAPVKWDILPVLPVERFLLSVLLGVLMGFLFTILFRTRLVETEKVIILTGLLLFGGGMSHLVGISPLFVTLLAGVLLGNFSLKRDETFHLLVRIERPLYLIFLIVAGACLGMGSFRVFLFVLSYCTVRAIARGVAGGVFLQSILPQLSPPRRMRLGWGLISQGGVAVALAIHFRLWFLEHEPSLLFQSTFSVLVISILINELVSPFGLAAAMKEE
jgi:hypothetical protein